MTPPRFRLLSLALAALAFGLACNALQSRSGPAPAATAAPTRAPQPTASSRQLEVFDAVWQAVRDQYVRADYDGADWDAARGQYRPQVEAGLSEEDFNRLVRQLLAELPPGQARFETRAERLEAETTDTRQYQGIGAFISFREEPQPHVVILAVIPGSPAEQAGLQPHDSIYAVDGEPVQAEERDTIANRIRGPADTEVLLSLQRPGQARRDLTVQRGQITATDVLRGGQIPQAQVAFYRLPVVADVGTAEQIAASLQQMAGEGGLRGVILDLRVARESALGWPLIPLLTVFGDGSLGEFYSRAGAEPVEVEGQDFGGSQTLPLVLLIGPDTQGSAEIFAAALQAAGRATLVGLPTSGQVEGFQEIALPDGSRLFLATSSYRSPDGLDLAQAGVQPDLRQEADWDAVTDGSDPVRDAALDHLAP